MTQPSNNLKTIFNLEFDIQYYLKIVNVFQFDIENDILPNKNEVNVEFIF